MYLDRYSEIAELNVDGYYDAGNSAATYLGGLPRSRKSGLKRREKPEEIREYGQHWEAI